MWRTPAAAAAPSAARPGLGAGHAHRRLDRRRALVHLLQVVGQVAGEVVERAAGRRHVHEAEQRRAQLGVLRGQLHRLLRRARAGDGGTAPGKAAWIERPTSMKLRLHDPKTTPAGYACRPCRRSYSDPCCATWARPRRCSGWRPTRPARSRSSARASAPSASAATTTRSSCCGDLEPRQLARVRGAARRRARLAAGRRLPRERLPHLPEGGAAPDRVRLVPRGRAARAALLAAKDEDPRGREIDALRTLALRMRDQPREEWPDVLLMLGDQVYADEVSPGNARVHRDAPRHRPSRPASACSTSRSTRGSTARAGATRPSAGCSPRSRRR